jgi:hypothetical protein
VGGLFPIQDDAMTDIDRIVADGFSLSDGAHQLTGLALLSLRIALRAYF